MFDYNFIKKNKNKQFMLKISSIMLIFLSIFFCMSQFVLPAPLSLDVNERKFSAGRAYGYLKQFAIEPHYIGTVSHDKVRDVIMNELEGMGLKPEIQSADALNGFKYAKIENIVFKIDGSEGNKTILITGHYDSVSGSNGASDDGMAVSCIFESARALLASDKLKNNIVFLLSDGEEMGLIGAKAFFDKHPWASKIDMVINFDARGNNGVPILYQTSDKNTWLVSQYKDAAESPVGSSILYDIYKNMPNVSDFGVYKAQGLSGLNIANAEGMNTYHNSSDNLSTIDKKSIQQFGNNMLALIRHFGNLEQWNTGKRNSIFFSLCHSVMITYPMWLSYPLLVLVIMLFLYTFISGLRRKNIHIKSVLLGACISLVILILCYFVGSMLFKLLCALNANAGWYLSTNDYTFSIPCLIGIILISFSCCLPIFQLAKRRLSTYDLIFGSHLIWTLLACATTLFLPGGSYIFTWSLLFNLIGFNLTVRKANLYIGISFTVPTILLSVPIIYFMFLMLGLQMGGILSFTIALLFIIYVPLIEQINKRISIIVPAAGIIAGLIAITVIDLTIYPSPENPVGTEVNYVLDKDRNEAKLVSIYTPNRYYFQFLGTDVLHGIIELPLYRSDVYYSKASVEQLAEPIMKVVSDTISDDKRTLEFEVQSQRNAPITYLQLKNEITIYKAVVNGEVQINNTATYNTGKNPYYLMLANMKGKTSTITITVSKSDKLNFEVFDITFDLPRSLLEGKQVSGKDIANYGDKTIVIKRYTVRQIQ